MWPDHVSNSGPLAFESDALPTGLRSLATAQVLLLLWGCRKEKQKYVAGPGIEPGPLAFESRRATDWATWPGHCSGTSVVVGNNYNN